MTRKVVQPVTSAWIDELPVEHATGVRQQPQLAHVARALMPGR